MRRVIRYQTSTILSTRRWRRKRKVAGAKQSIRRSQGGPPPSSRIWWWRWWPSTQRLKVTYGLPRRKSSRHPRAFSYPYYIFEDACNGLWNVDTSRRTPWRLLSSDDRRFIERILTIISDLHFRHSFAIVMERYASQWYFSGSTRRRCTPRLPAIEHVGATVYRRAIEMSREHYQRVRLRDDQFICNLYGIISMNVLCRARYKWYR